MDQHTFEYHMDWSRPVAHLQDVLQSVSEPLSRRWHFRGMDDRCYGVPADEMAEVVADADLFLNVSGSAVLRDGYLPSRRKVYVDTDPGWNHFMRWPSAPPNPVDHGLDAHDAFATYAERLGAADCLLPDLGRTWHPTRPPVVTELWSDAGAAPALPDGPWTTVLSWDNSPLPIEHDGVTYGTKERSFHHIEDLPADAPAPLEVAAGGARPPVEHWRQLGWSVVDAPSVSTTPEAYRDYVRGSRGEFSIAKHVYVATRCGWFSCRTTCYLAAGRPAVVQDTGFSEFLDVGEGAVPFADRDGALEGLRRVEGDRAGHAEAARDLATTAFEAETVLAALCDRVGVNG